jgi:hypothetical protein
MLRSAQPAVSHPQAAFEGATGLYQMHEAQ